MQAYIPDQHEDPQLFEAVQKFMMHGPCGLQNPTCPCMENGRCKKHFPKDFSEETMENVDDYPVYAPPSLYNAVGLGGHALAHNSLLLSKVG